MSAILEALKKSETHRKQIAADQLAPILVRPAARHTSPFAITLGLAALLALLFGFWSWFQEPERHVAGTPLQARVPHSVSAETMPVSTGISSTNRDKPVSESKPSLAKVAVSNVSLVPEPVHKVPLEPAATSRPVKQTLQRTTTQPTKHAHPAKETEQKPVAVAESTRAKGLHSIHELPPDLRVAAQALHINVIQFSETPGSSWALINMEKHVEGDRLAGDFLLQEIRPQSLLLQYGSWQFELPITSR